MFGFGVALLSFGIGSIVLNFIDYEFVMLMWVDNWGTEIGWWIRGAMITGGVVLCIAGVATADSDGEEIVDLES